MELEDQKKPTEASDQDDKISKLPDALIHHIYSFLPTETVLSTCILSKRWKHLSNSAPILTFHHWETYLKAEDYKKEDVQKIMNIVDTVLIDHERPKIQKFVLNVDGRFDETRVNRWITTVITRKVEELGLNILSLKPCVSPLSFFTCDSLIELNLDYHDILNLPDTIYFPRIKTIWLAYVKFVNENSTGKLFANCPILEYLRLVNCQFQDLKVLCITSRTLKHLTILDGSMLDLSHLTLKITAPNLLTIIYTANTPADFVLGSFPSLVEAHIEIKISWDHPRMSSLINLYQKLSNVRLLRTSRSSIQRCPINLETVGGMLNYHPNSQLRLKTEV